jgi:hypothetical protein
VLVPAFGGRALPCPGNTHQEWGSVLSILDGFIFHLWEMVI